MSPDDGHGADPAELLARIRRLERTNAALMDRVERAVDGCDNAYGVFQSNLVLRRAIRDRTAELAAVNTSLHLEVAERRRSEDAMREAQRVARLGNWTWDRRTGTTLWSPQLLELFGRDPDAPALSPTEMVTEFADGDDERLMAALEKALDRGDPFSLVLRTRRAAAGVRRLRVEGRARRDDHAATIGLYGTTADVTEQVEREEALAEITTALDVANDCVFIFDARTLRFVYTNQGAAAQVGWTAEELRAMSPLDITAGHDEQTFHALIQPLREQPARSVVVRTEHRHRDGRHVPVEISLQLVPELGSHGRFVAIVRDITEQLAAEERLRAASLSAEAANLAKSEFLANMSHEIRTPMTAILGFAGLLQDEPAVAADPEQSADAIARIRRNAEHLLTLVNDILDMSKIEAGHMRIERITFDPMELALEVARLMDGRAAEKGLRLQVHHEAPIPARIESDPTRLRQILLNLVGNAIKFTEAGSVDIRLSADADTGLMHFAVEDDGIGMTREDVDRVARFDPFFQTDSSMTRRFGGTGLGLRISNALAELLGGGIDVRSEPGRGSVFRVAVDAGVPLGGTDAQPGRSSEGVLTPGATSTPDTPRSSPGAQPLSGLQLLLAEDGPDNQRLIATLLRRAGAEVSVVEHGLAALAHVAAAEPGRGPDIILMDMQMPELDGYGATRRLRAQGEEAVIIALTAHAMSGDRERCLEAGCDDYLTKPVDRRQLIGTCLAWSRRRGTIRTE